MAVAQSSAFRGIAGTWPGRAGGGRTRAAVGAAPCSPSDGAAPAGACARNRRLPRPPRFRATNRYVTTAEQAASLPPSMVASRGTSTRSGELAVVVEHAGAILALGSNGYIVGSHSGRRRSSRREPGRGLPYLSISARACDCQPEKFCSPFCHHRRWPIPVKSGETPRRRSPERSPLGFSYRFPPAPAIPASPASSPAGGQWRIEVISGR